VSIPKELQGLNKGDSIEGGTFMQALDDEPVLWQVKKPYDEVKQSLTLDAFWLGIHLGEFLMTSKGVERVGS
jgi:hypothetical protein